jgi:hypothetical protein
MRKPIETGKSSFLDVDIAVETSMSFKNTANNPNEKCHICWATQRHLTIFSIGIVHIID